MFFQRAKLVIFSEIAKCFGEFSMQSNYFPAVGAEDTLRCIAQNIAEQLLARQKVAEK